MTSVCLIVRLIDRIRDRIDTHAEELTKLDQAIGDGDHGDNMRRGFEAIAAERAAIVALPFNEALVKAGMILVMKVGGASGPLFGSGLIAMGKAQEGERLIASEVTRMLRAGVDAVKARGKSDVGAKTMLDVLVPVLCAVEAGANLETVRHVANESVEATRPMRATKGRAAFLGERSVGHVDPGARSSALIIDAVCDALEEE